MGVPVEFFVSGEVGVFFFSGAGDAAYVDEGAGVGVGKDAFPGDEAGEGVDGFSGQGDGGEVAQEGGGGVFFPFLFVVFVVHAFDPVDEPGEEGGCDAEGEPALGGADAVASGACFPLGGHESDFVELFGFHDEGEFGEDAASGLAHAFLCFGEGLGSEFEALSYLVDGGLAELCVGERGVVFLIEFFCFCIVGVGEGVHGMEVGLYVHGFNEVHGGFGYFF